MTVAERNDIVLSDSKVGLHTTIVIGNGPVGQRIAEKLLTLNPYHRVIIFGEESSPAYNRAKLSSVLANQQCFDSLFIKQVPNHRHINYLGRQVVAIDPLDKSVSDQFNQKFHYDSLVIATGSRAKQWPEKLPNIEGFYYFRSIEDLNKLKTLRDSQLDIAVIGAGSLGIETALALKTQNNKIHVIARKQVLGLDGHHHAIDWVLSSLIEQGIHVHEHTHIKEFKGLTKIESLTTYEGENIQVDAVVFCIGIEPNISLTQHTGIKTNKGIIVNESCETNLQNIYAIGECCEQNGKLIGTIAPGLHQADKAAESILNIVSHPELFGNEFNEPSVEEIILKVSQRHTVIFGDPSLPSDMHKVYNDRKNGVYRKLLFRNNRLFAAIIIGLWHQENQVKEAILQKSQFSSSVLFRFEQTGYLDLKTTKTVRHKPDEYLICLCEQVTKKQITDCISQGNRNLESIAENCKAGSNCGSCQPRILELLDQPAENLFVRFEQTIKRLSIISLIIIGFIISLPAFKDWTFSFESVQYFWSDSLGQQISGYTLLALILVAGSLSAKRRLKIPSIGHLDSWRLFHSIIGIISLLTLIFHTGLSLGNNLNFALILIFLLATTTGSLIGLFMANNHHWSDEKLRHVRLWWTRLHFTLLWCLPSLLIFHILIVYYF